MKKKLSFTVIVLLIIAVVASLLKYLHGTDIALLNPQGLIALKERNLLLLVTALSMIVVVPVFVLTIFVGWKYREGNAASVRNPDWDYKLSVEIVWWAVPTILIIIFSVITWNSTHDLDPFKPIQSSVKPLVIQVVAMDWKWLFIYPQQGIATVNFFQFPENTPVEFEITSDAPMNSFWIPQLGSQIYAMPSMSTELNLIASTTGVYTGSSANISGAGFSGMTFLAKSSSQDDFNSWVQSLQQSSNKLNADTYNLLAEPSTNDPVSYYSNVTPDLYYKIMMKDMMQASAVATDTDMNGSMNMQNNMDMQ